MTKPKQVQIDYTLFLELVKYVNGCTDNKSFIQAELMKKLTSINKHDLYTAIKEAKTPAEKKAAQQKYDDYIKGLTA
jgi:hypothetical protein